MTEQEIMTFVAQVKPVGLTVMYIMANMIRQQVGVVKLATLMDTTRQRLAPVMERLVTYGYVYEIPNGRHPLYVLTERAKRLPLFDLAALSGMTLAGHPVQLEEQAEPLALPGEPSEVKNNFLPRGSVVVDPDQKALANQDQQQQQKRARLKNLTSESPEEIRRRDVAEACRRAGIAGEKRRNIVQQPVVQPDWIARTLRQVELENRLGIGVEQWGSVCGQAIYRLESGIEPMTDTEMDELEAEHNAESQAQAERDAAANERAEQMARERESRSEVKPTTPPDPSVNRRLTGGASSGMTASQVWQATLGEVQLQMTKPTFETWVKPCELIAYENGEFVVSVPTVFVKDWLERKLLSSFKRCLAGITGLKSPEVTFVVQGEQDEQRYIA